MSSYSFLMSVIACMNSAILSPAPVIPHAILRFLFLACSEGMFFFSRLFLVFFEEFGESLHRFLEAFEAFFVQFGVFQVVFCPEGCTKVCAEKSAANWHHSIEDVECVDLC